MAGLSFFVDCGSYSVRHQLTPVILLCQQRMKSSVRLSGIGQNIDEEQKIKKICDISGLSDNLKCKLSHVNKLPENFHSKHFRNLRIQRDEIRKQYAMLGSASGIHPGVMWDTKEEYKEHLAEDLHAHSLEERLRILRNMQHEEEAQKKEQLARVKLRMEVLMPELIAERMAAAQRAIQREEQGTKSSTGLAALVQQAREYLGYNVTAADPEVKALREKIMRETRSQKKLQERQNRLMSRRGMVEKQPEQQPQQTAQE